MSSRLRSAFFFSAGAALGAMAGAEALTGAYLSGLEEAAGRRCGAVAMGLLGLSAGAAAEVSVKAGVRAASVFLRRHDMSIVLSVPVSAVVRFDDGFYAALREYIHARYTSDGTTGIFNREFYRLDNTAAVTSAAAPALSPKSPMATAPHRLPAASSSPER